MDTTITQTELRALGAGVNLTEIRRCIGELEALANAKIEAAEQYNDAVTMAAIKCGVIKSVLAQYINARVTDTVKKKAQSAEQLSLLFGEEI